MAAIDKMYFNYEEYQQVIPYFESIDNEFKQVFKNAGTIFNWVYKHDWNQIEDKTKRIPVTNFPELIDRWLMKQDNLPQPIVRELQTQYNNSFIDLLNEDFSSRELKPKVNKVKLIYAEYPSDATHYLHNYKFLNGRSSPLALHITATRPGDHEHKEQYYSFGTNEWFNYYDDDKHPDMIGMEITLTYRCKIKTIRALIRKLRSFHAEKGTVFEVVEYGKFGNKTESFRTEINKMKFVVK